MARGRRARGADRGGGGGVDVEPLDAAIGAVVRKLLGAEFDLDEFAAFAATEPVLAKSSRGCAACGRRSRRIRSSRSSRRSRHSRSRSTRRSRSAADSSSGSGSRRPRLRRFPRASASRPRGGGARGVGFSRRKAEYIVGLARSDLDLDGLAALPDDEVKARLVELRGHRRVDGGVVPRAPPRAAARVARRRHRAAQGGGALLRRRGRACGAASGFEPFQNLSAHYLLAALYAGVGS